MIRILIADDHRIFRDGLARLLGDQEDFDLVVTSAGHEEALRDLQSQKFDIAILDLWTLGNGEIDKISFIKNAVQSSTKILVINLHSLDHFALQALRAGADGYLTMEDTAQDVVFAIRQILRGVRYVCPAVAARLALAKVNENQSAAHQGLSHREFEVFEMLVAGKRGAQIASELHLSAKTVSTYKSHVLRKLSAKSSTDLVRYAIRNQLVCI